MHEWEMLDSVSSSAKWHGLACTHTHSLIAPYSCVVLSSTGSLILTISSRWVALVPRQLPWTASLSCPALPQPVPQWEAAWVVVEGRHLLISRWPPWLLSFPLPLPSSLSGMVEFLLMLELVVTIVCQWSLHSLHSLGHRSIILNISERKLLCEVSMSLWFLCFLSPFTKMFHLWYLFWLATHASLSSQTGVPTAVQLRRGQLWGWQILPANELQPPPPTNHNVMMLLCVYHNMCPLSQSLYLAPSQPFSLFCFSGKILKKTSKWTEHVYTSLWLQKKTL